MLSSLGKALVSPLSKYMLIAILVLAGALGGAMWLSFKFYGQKEVAEAATEQLEVVVDEEREQTEKAVQATELINNAVNKVREGENEIEKASEKLQKEVSVKDSHNPTGDIENEVQSATEPCDDFLTDDDIRMLTQAHCLTDGDASDCY